MLQTERNRVIYLNNEIYASGIYSNQRGRKDFRSLVFSPVVCVFR